MPDVLIYADTLRSPELRHEVPVAISDPFLYAERGGSRYVGVWSLEEPRLEGLPDLETFPYEELGLDELIERGVDREELYLHLGLSFCRRLGFEHVAVPATFPLALADYLRSQGIGVSSNRELFASRRRVKTVVELDGIRRAQRAAEAAMDAVRELLSSAKANGRGVSLEGVPLTCERLKQAVGEVFSSRGVAAEEFIVAHGAQSAIGHEMGSGAVASGEPIVVDLWPRDRETGCYADMTRTYVVGDPPEELDRYHRLCLEALQGAIGAIKPGVPGRSVYAQTCELFHAHGYPTQMSKAPGEVLADGFFHGLGHGVGLEVHEEPGVGIASRDALVAADVVALEPGLYRRGFGGCRIEDVVLVGEQGAENLTDYPYDLVP